MYLIMTHHLSVHIMIHRSIFFGIISQICYHIPDSPDIIHGFLYTGADLGGFGCNTTRDLLLRWLALGVFTPLMRNHACLGTREQECYHLKQPSYIHCKYMEATDNEHL